MIEETRNNPPKVGRYVEVPELEARVAKRMFIGYRGHHFLCPDQDRADALVEVIRGNGDEPRWFVWSTDSEHSDDTTGGAANG